MDKNYDDFFNELYTQLYRKMLEYAFKITGNKDDAEEVAQETFLQVIRQIDALYKHENVAGWLYLTTKNNALNTIKINKRLKNIISSDDIDIPVEDNIELDLLFHGCLNKEETDILKRFYQYRQSLKEIAGDYNISVTACKMRLIRAREKLKNNFEK